MTSKVAPPSANTHSPLMYMGLASVMRPPGLLDAASRRTAYAAGGQRARRSALCSAFYHEHQRGLSTPLIPPRRTALGEVLVSWAKSYRRQVLSTAPTGQRAERRPGGAPPGGPRSAAKGLGSTGERMFATLWALCGMPAVSVEKM